MFLKAVSTISKQQHDSPTASSSNSTTSSDKPPFPNFGVGMPLVLFLSQLPLIIKLDELRKVLSIPDFNVIVRARDVITDSIMVEVEKENFNGPTEFQNSVRVHINSFVQRIKVSLLVLEKLMEIMTVSRRSAD